MAHFIDEARIQVIAGPGGNGCMSFRREKFEAMGGPNGGNGGNGGNVILIAKRNVHGLANFKGQYRFKAKKGKHGEGKDKTGATGENLLLEVPIGTIVKDEDTGQVLGDLLEEHQKLLVARGGAGGRGNASFKSSTNQAPRRTEDGKEGQIKNLKLELKVMADVGLVGFPNAGKSTLISKISNAAPEVGAYPFTTLTPHLGVVSMNRWEYFVMADIPGIIEGAHEGKGLGFRFLKHIERTSLLLFMIDVFEEDPAEVFFTLKSELENYQAGLLEKPFLVALNKCDDLTDDLIEYRLNEFLEKTKLDKEKVFTISGLKGLNMTEMKKVMFEMVQELKAQRNELSENN